MPRMYLYYINQPPLTACYCERICFCVDFIHRGIRNTVTWQTWDSSCFPIISCKNENHPHTHSVPIVIELNETTTKWMQTVTERLTTKNMKNFSFLRCGKRIANAMPWCAVHIDLWWKWKRLRDQWQCALMFKSSERIWRETQKKR